jgi:hypothetical protein
MNLISTYKGCQLFDLVIIANCQSAIVHLIDMMLAHEIPLPYWKPNYNILNSFFSNNNDNTGKISETNYSHTLLRNRFETLINTPLATPNNMPECLLHRPILILT